MLGADPRAVALLASSNRPTWQALVAVMKRSEVCPEKLVLALLGVDGFDGWRARLFRAFVGLNPDDGMEADWAFRLWFTAGVAGVAGGKSLRELQFRFASAVVDGAIGHLQRLRDLTRDIEMSLRTGDDQPAKRDLLAGAILHLAVREGDEGHYAEELVLAQRAEGIFAEQNASEWVAQSRRVQAGALLCLRRFDEALALIDSVWDKPRPDFNAQCSFRSVPRLEPIADLLRSAAHIACWASRREPQWLDVVKSIGEKLVHPGCLAWYEAHRPKIADVTTNASDVCSTEESFEDEAFVHAQWR